MKFNDHGAETNNIYKEFNVEKPIHVIDFSTNTNVLQSEHDIQELMTSIDITTYPDANNSQVISGIIANLRESNNVSIDPINIIVTNGSNEAIYIIASYFSGDQVAILQPTYPEYEKALKAYNAKVNYVFNLDEMINSEYKCIFICNPNNPTGKYIEWDHLSKVMDQLEKLGTILVIDEAYIDFLTLEDQDLLISHYKRYENLIILRSLTKNYQLAGLRLGYVIGSEKWINLIKRRQPTWSVNSVAGRVALDYLKNQKLMDDTKAFYKYETRRVIKKLRSLGHNIEVNNVNFYLLKTENDVKLIKYLLSKGIIVRHTRNHPGLDGNYVRIAVRSSDDNDYLIKVLSSNKEYRGIR